ncbi:unnamed protein product [Paramecium primaurelia]|uniref:Uncharacterized protein n=1 Tax=Paramecium primaurelia TaxID=5886 RepID=A0A8S1MWE6_PARPR|nr:unnamed protein product [Paramecium primaurelia]
MSNIEKQIQKQRKLSNDVEYTYNSTEIFTNSSFFDEERSQDFQDDNSSVEEDFQDNWEMSSICTENSSNPNSIEENQTIKRITKRPNPVMPIRVEPLIDNRAFIDASKSINKNSNSGKGIAINVLGHGSICKQSKKDKKQQKLLSKQYLGNNNNNSQQHQNQNQQNNNQSDQLQGHQLQQRGSVQENKQINQCQKVTLSYLLMEREVEKQAQIRAINFIEKYIKQQQQVEDVIQMIQETYKILLIPDLQMQQLAAVLSQEERDFQLNLSLLRLNLNKNIHPLAKKAESKIKQHFQLH